jgi:hypothetical protein
METQRMTAVPTSSAGLQPQIASIPSSGLARLVARATW